MLKSEQLDFMMITTLFLMGKRGGKWLGGRRQALNSPIDRTIMFAITAYEINRAYKL